MEAGESLTEACAREVLEETGLRVSVTRLISVYTNPYLLLEYPDGNRLQLVVLHFEVKRSGGQLSRSDEAAEVKYFSQAEAMHLEAGRLDRLRIQDAFLAQAGAVIRDEF